MLFSGYKTGMGSVLEDHCPAKTCNYQRDLTTVSPVYSEDSVVHQRAASLNLLVHSTTDSVLSGVRGLISELKPEQHNLHL